MIDYDHHQITVSALLSAAEADADAARAHARIARIITLDKEIRKEATAAAGAYASNACRMRDLGQEYLDWARENAVTAEQSDQLDAMGERLIKAAMIAEQCWQSAAYHTDD